MAAYGMAKRAPRGWHTRSDAAEAIGRSRETIKRWEKNGLCAPTGCMTIGSLRVLLYSDADLELLRQVADQQVINQRIRKPRLASAK